MQLREQIKGLHLLLFLLQLCTLLPPRAPHWCPNQWTLKRMNLEKKFPWPWIEQTLHLQASTNIRKWSTMNQWTWIRKKIEHNELVHLDSFKKMKSLLVKRVSKNSSSSGGYRCPIVEEKLEDVHVRHNVPSNLYVFIIYNFPDIVSFIVFQDHETVRLFYLVLIALRSFFYERHIEIFKHSLFRR